MGYGIGFVYAYGMVVSVIMAGNVGAHGNARYLGGINGQCCGQFLVVIVGSGGNEGVNGII